MASTVAFIRWDNYAGGPARQGIFASEPLTYNSSQERLHRLAPGDRLWLVSRCPDDQQYYFVGALSVSALRLNPPGSSLERFGRFAVIADESNSHDLGKHFPADGLLRAFRFESDKPIRFGTILGQSIQTIRFLSATDEQILQAALGRILSGEQRLLDAPFGLWTKCDSIFAEYFLKNFKAKGEPLAFLLYDSPPVLTPGAPIFIHSDKNLRLLGTFRESQFVAGHKYTVDAEERFAERERIWSTYRAGTVDPPTRQDFDSFWERQNGVRALFVMDNLHSISVSCPFKTCGRALEWGYPIGVGYRYLSLSQCVLLLRYRLSRSDYERDWGKEYSKPGFGARVLAVFMYYLPKIGPFKAMAFKNPNPKTEEMYFKSINTSVDQCRAYLEELRTDSLQLSNIDFDTGKKTKAAEYTLTDASYAKLLAKLSDRKFDRTSPELRENILNFYGDLSAPIETKKDSTAWQAVLTSLDQLKALTPIPASAGSPPPSQAPVAPPAPALTPAFAQAPVVSAGKHFDRVLNIVLENQNYTSAMKDPFWPQLAQMGASFSNFQALMHPSHPNYLAMVAGSTFGIQSNDQVTLPDDNSHRTIGDFLDWKSYAEDYPSELQPLLGDRGKYVRKHVPFLSFARIQQEGFGNAASVSAKDPHNRFVADVEDFRSGPKKHPFLVTCSTAQMWTITGPCH